jgi:hypothetical protein
MYFSSSSGHARVPLVLVCGTQTFARRALVSRLLRQLPTRFFTLLAQRPESLSAFDGHVVQWFDGAMGANEGDCLCCGLGSGLGDALRRIFLSALSSRGERLERVLIDTDTIRVEQLRQTLRHTPFLGQRFVHHATLWVVEPAEFDAQRLNSVLLDTPGPAARVSQVGGVIRSVVVSQPVGCERVRFEAAFEAIRDTIAAAAPEIGVVRCFSDTLAADMRLLP